MSQLTLPEQAIVAIQNAQFRTMWPIEVRQALVRGAKHEGDLPEFGAKQIRWALKEARQVENRMSKQIDEGLAVAPRKILVKA
jgi:hypothetical protein